MKIITVVGVRPQFVKAATISRVLRNMPDVQEILVHTGQHYDRELSNVFFEELKIQKPDYNLGVVSATHGAQTGQMLEEIEKTLFKTKPDCMLVYGDTNSTLAAALSAVKIHIPVAHVEAGLRSFDKRMPEEINRIVTDHISVILFAPTETSVKNLLHEGICKDKIYQVGDVMYDAALFFANIAEKQSAILERLSLKPKSFILTTIHRPSNTDNPQNIRAIFEALEQMCNTYPVVAILHPRTRLALHRESIFERFSRKIVIIEPVGYFDMIMLERNAKLIVTDSGGIQKEAFFYEVPCVTLREQTEWVELVELGWNHLAIPIETDNIIEVIRAAVGTTGRKANPYGDGLSAEKIVRILLGKHN